MQTRWPGIAGAALMLATGGALAQVPSQTPQAVGQPEIVKLDYLQYEGRYYEIARLPTYRERNCHADTVMTFLRRTDGDVSVVYQCFEEDRTWIMDIGRLDTARGEERPGELPFRADQIGWAPWLSGTYRLIELGGDYSYAMIGDASHSRLWIVSRTRHMDPATYDRLLKRATERGYDTARLVRSVQNGL
jgi:apolipoprotein D and lipocalin family protein